MGIAERREREKEQRRKEIIDAAEKVFFREGFGRASMEQVAAESELSKGTLYLYFKSKEELYFAIFLRGQELLYSIVDKELLRRKETSEKIKAFLKSLLVFHKKYPEYFQAFFYFTTNPVEINKDSPEFIKSHEIDMGYLNKWIELINQGKEENIVRSDLEAVPSALLIWLQSIGMLKMHSVLSADLETMFGLKADQLLDEYFDLVFNGVFARKRPGRDNVLK